MSRRLPPVSSAVSSTVSSWRLLVRALTYHRGQSVAAALVTALITAGAVFAPWYTQMVDDTVTRQAFAVGAPGSTLRLTGSDQASLEELLPASSDRLLTEPIAGRHAELLWDAANQGKPVAGGMTWREDICDHLVLLEGRCPEPPSADATAVEAAVSEADAAMYDVRVGDVLPELNSTVDAVDFVVTGVYRLADPTDPYWFEVLPTGRSGLGGPMLVDPFADLFVVAREGVTFGTGTATRLHQNTLDTRVEGASVTAADLPALRGLVERVRSQTDGTAAGVATSMDDTFDYLDRTQDVTATTMLVTAAQVAVLAMVVLAMLVGVALIQRRPELGLSRLRGRSAGSLVRALAAQWGVVVLVGAVLGAVLGLVAAAAARGAWLPGPPPLAPPGRVALWLGAAVVAAVLLLVVMARPVVREPVPALLRSTGSRSAGAGGSGLLVDGVLVTAAVCGLVVGLQSSEDSALALLAPSLLAVAASVLLARLVGWAAGRLSTRWLARGRTARALTGVQIARGRGTRLLLTVLCMAAAFAVFSTQYATVAADNRTHRARVEAGAAAVDRVGVPPATLRAALDEVDPEREQATMVLATAPSGADALGTLFVEPAAFSRIAFGALDAAPAADWASLTAPDEQLPEMTGRTLRVTVAPHDLRPEEPGTRLDVAVDYLSPRGYLRTAQLGSVPATTDRPRTLAADIGCTEGCGLLRWTIDPDDAVTGELVLTDVETVDRDGAATPVDLGSASDWPLAVGAATDATFEAGVGSLTVSGSSGGLPLSAQHASVPGTVPVVLAHEHPPAGDYTDPTVLSPEGTVLPVEVTTTAAEAIPRVLRDHVVADVAAVLRRGEHRLSGGSTLQVWYADAAARDAVSAALAERGIETDPVDTVGDHAAVFESSAEALSGRIYLAAAALAVLLGVLALVVSVAATWRARTRDLAALRMVGLDRRTLLRSACGVYVVVVLAATATGVACGLLGFALAIKRTPLFTVPEPEIPLDLLPDPATGLVVLVLVAAVLTLAAVLCGRWLVGRSTLHRIREAGE